MTTYAIPNTSSFDPGMLSYTSAPGEMDYAAFDDFYLAGPDSTLDVTASLPQSFHGQQSMSRQPTPASPSTYASSRPGMTEPLASTTSSNTGSPMINGSINTHFPSFWMTPEPAMSSGMAVTGAEPFQMADPAAAFDYNALIAGDGASGFVGESNHVSSFRQSSRPSHAMPGFESQPVFPSASASSAAPHVQHGQDLVEVSGPMMSSAGVASLHSSPGTFSSAYESVSPQIQSSWTSSEATFRVPDKPASASSEPRSRSRSLKRNIQRQARQYPQTFFPEQASPSQNMSTSPTSYLAPFDMFPVPSQSPFQHQYSGNSLVPLDSSNPSIFNSMLTPAPSTAPSFIHDPSQSTPSFPQSPAHSQHSPVTFPQAPAQSPRSQSPYVPHSPAWQQNFPQPTASRPPSMFSNSPRSQSMEFTDEEGRERSRCPYPECGKPFKDLKAHMLTHQNERPEKCPITSCEFHKRGFARKYDRNRHLVTTHYKSTIICGFCPGAGTPSEKCFNRTDVFKRHLVSVHGVEQNPPNGRKKSPTSGKGTASQDTTGKCSTCGDFFSTPQDLFEHLDDCVLRVVNKQQSDPTEANNETNLMSVIDDPEVKDTIERHMMAETSQNGYAGFEMDEDEAEDEASSKNPKSGRGSIKSTKDQLKNHHTVTSGAITKPNAQNPNLNNSRRGSTTTVGTAGIGARGRGGITYSKGGVAMSVGKGGGRKKKKHYPPSWGCNAEAMKLKKRVLCVFDGQRRLCKDDMMLGNDFEVRVKLPGGDGTNYVTDLDVETMKRAEAFHNCTEEERGPWVRNNFPEGVWGSMAGEGLMS